MGERARVTRQSAGMTGAPDASLVTTRHGRNRL